MSNEKRLPGINEAFSAWLTQKHEAMKGGERLAGDFDVPMLDVLHESTYVALSVCGHIVDLGLDGNDPSVLEGMLLAMQMMGGPAAAAWVVGYCSPTRQEKTASSFLADMSAISLESCRRLREALQDPTASADRSDVPQACSLAPGLNESGTAADADPEVGQKPEAS